MRHCAGWRKALPPARCVPVEAVESFVRHQYLAPDLKFGRIIAVKLLRDVGDTADIVRDVIADHAVSARQCAEKLSVPIRQANGCPVELELAAIGE